MNLEPVLIYGLVFAGGCALGAFLTAKKYEDQIQSIKDTYAPRTEKKPEPKPFSVDPVDAPKPITGDFHDPLKTYERMTEPYKPDMHDLSDEATPYNIGPDELGETDYDVINLYLTADGYVVDDDSEPIPYYQDILGDGLYALGAGDNHEPLVWIRNDKTKCDYEVAYTQKTYEEMSYFKRRAENRDDLDFEEDTT